MYMYYSLFACKVSLTNSVPLNAVAMCSAIYRFYSYVKVRCQFHDVFLYSVQVQLDSNKTTYDYELLVLAAQKYFTVFVFMC